MRRQNYLKIACTALLALGAPRVGAAEPVAPPPFPQFEAKRIGTSSAGGGRKLVQIDPEAEPFALTPQGWTRPPEAAITAPRRVVARQPETDANLKSQTAAWFWDKISPSLVAANPSRLKDALAQLSLAPDGAGINAPSLSELEALAQTYAVPLMRESAGARISPAFALAVIWVESRGRPEAVSSAGAGGLMQLMPATAARFGVEDRNNPGENIRGGVTYLDWLLERFGFDPILALAAYNAGEGAVDAYGGVPPYAETRAYVPKVLAAWSVARFLCQSPPESVSEGCLLGLKTASVQAD
ncbi:MAG: lytic transglycosylase domain-containing protein [Pseudomonadota bacterium]